MKATKNGFQGLMVVAVVLVGASITFGAGITSIGVLTPGEGGTTESAVNAVSPDGQYAVGYSNGTATILNQDGTTTVFAGKIAVIWRAGTLTQLPLSSDFFTGAVRANDTMATGVVVRPVAGKIGIGGGFYTEGIGYGVNQMISYSAPLNNLGGGVWIDNTSAPSAYGAVAPYNSARLRTNGTEQWFIGGDRVAGVRDFVMGVDGGPSLDHRTSTDMTKDCISNSVNGTGHTAGSDNGNPSVQRRALYMNRNNDTTQTIIPGGSGIKSEAYGISPNPAKPILSGYDTDADGHSQAFVWKPGDAAMTLIGTLEGDTQANAITVNLIDSQFITGGFSSDGTTERAVIWDQTGNWDSTGQAKSLLSLLSDAGMNVSDWSSLTRVTTMSDDGKTLAGYGVWASDGTTRGFVATIPEPASLLLLSLGGLALLRRNRR